MNETRILPLEISVGLLTVPLTDLVSDATRPLLLLLHGRGADERDLAGRIRELPSRYAFALLRAPIPFGPEGYSWFSPADGRAAFPPRAAAMAVERWLSDRRLDAPDREISLLGFSGGAVVALEMLRRRPARYEAIVNLGGYLDRSEEQAPPFSTRSPTRVFWGRGDNDLVIGGDHVEGTRAWLQVHTALTERVYPGIAHSVSDEEIADASSFLARRSPLT